MPTGQQSVQLPLTDVRGPPTTAATAKRRCFVAKQQTVIHRGHAATNRQWFWIKRSAVEGETERAREREGDRNSKKPPLGCSSSSY